MRSTEDPPEARLLIVAIDLEVASALAPLVAEGGCKLVIASTCDDAITYCQSSPPALIVIDHSSRTLGGMEACRRLRAASGLVPMVIVAERHQVSEVVAALDAGVSDYIFKPIQSVDYSSRVQVALARANARAMATLAFQDLSLDIAAREVWRGDRQICLTKTEFDLLRLFLEHPLQVLTRDVIHERVWGYWHDAESKVIEVFVRHLREKLEASGESRLIHTNRGAGYVLRGPE